MVAILDAILISGFCPAVLHRYSSVSKSIQSKESKSIIISYRSSAARLGWFCLIFSRLSGRNMSSWNIAYLTLDVTFMVRVVGLVFMGLEFQILLSCLINTRWGWFSLSSFRGRQNEHLLAGMIKPFEFPPLEWWPVQDCAQ